jgi:hypothetical protein
MTAPRAENNDRSEFSSTKVPEFRNFLAGAFCKYENRLSA